MEASVQPDSPRVFISYAHEPPEHAEAVRDLWILLRACGINARLDLPAAQQRQDWRQWMTRELRDADFVLVVASPAYRERAEDDAKPDVGRGVQFEAGLIGDRVYADQKAGLTWALPVVLPGGSVDDIPRFLRPASTTLYALPTIEREGVESLLRALTDQPAEVEPPLGPIPTLPPSGHDHPTEAAPAPPQPVLAHELVLNVSCDDGLVHCRAELSGTLLSGRERPLPPGIATIWSALRRPVAAAEQQLADAGHRLRDALLDDTAVNNLTDLVHHSPLDTVIDIEVRGDGDALGLPYELLRLPDARLLCTVPGVRLHRVAAANRAVTPPLPGPLKILVAVGAPEETLTDNTPLDVEAEMQAILDAVAGVESAGRAQVKILEVSGPQQIEAALQADQFHVLHISAHGSPGGLELEDEDGNAVPVDAADLAARLRGAGRPLPLVVLSSCAGAAHATNGLAATLIARGVDRVLAMQAAVTDDYATKLARCFYDAMGVPGGETVAAALSVARRRVEDQRREAIRAGDIRTPPEYGVATLLTAGGDSAMIDRHAPPVELKDAIQAPAGGAVRQLRIGELIGRRSQLREALAALRGGEAAIERFGDVAGVVLTGVGGIGKTALAGRIVNRLRGDGWLIAIHEGSWNPTALTDAVAGALEHVSDPRLVGARELLRSPQVDDASKVDGVGQLLTQVHLLLLFDDFERNLDAGSGQFNDAGLAEVFARLCDAARSGRLLVTCRYPVPDPDGLLVRVEIPALSAAELRRLLLRLPALRALDPEDRKVVLRTIGGHPRLIEFVDALLRGGHGNLRELTRKLRKLAHDEGVALTGERALDETLSDAVLLGSRDIVLDELVAHLDEEERELALQAAVSRVPMSIADLSFARLGDDVLVDEQVRDIQRAVDRLIDLTLISRSGGEDIVMHPWVGQALDRHQDDAGPRHERAFAMRLRRLETGLGDLDDLVEACRHLSATDQFDDLVGFARQAATRLAGLTGELSVAAFLGEVLPMVPEGASGYLLLADREREALERSGNLSAAFDRASALLLITERLADANPSNTAAQLDHGVSHERLGDLALQAGDSQTATTHYNASLRIRQRLADANRTNATAQRELSVGHNKVGDLARQAGDTATATTHYHASLQIAQRLADADPTNATAQRDLSVFRERLGDLARQAGDTATATTHYNASLQITQRLADADPTNATAQRDLSVGHIKVGDLALQAGDSQTATTHYNASLQITQPLADADPTNATAQRGLSVSHNKVGDLARQAGDTATATTHYNASLQITQRLADADPTNATAQRDLSVSHDKVGDLARQAGDTATATTHYNASLQIAQRLADADPTNATAQRDLSVSHNKVGDLALQAGDTATATTHYNTSLQIAQRLADADPTNATAQRDLSICHDNVGDLALQAGDSQTATTHYDASLQIAQRLADADPTNATAQRDLSVSHNTLGNLALQAGDSESAATHYNASLQIAQRLADADPTNATAQRDLSVSHNKLGDLARQAGDTATATTHYNTSLQIRQRIADADPTNATAQRDLSISHNKVGDLALLAGDSAKATHHFGAALAVLEGAFGADDPWAVEIRQKLESLDDAPESPG